MQPAATNPHLFVYGTLLTGAHHPMGERLRREARLVGEASIGGRLYSLGRYPGLVETAGEDQGEGEIVHGEVYVLNNPANALKWLDAYEGIRPGSPAEYERVERAVQLASGVTLLAWVYLYRRSVGLRPPVPGGRWLDVADRA
jgi:gamma-glutamylcyclotransferase (GGCT)/AIG2-like uncharacterized protein YtfP